MTQGIQNQAGLKAQLRDFVHGSHIETHRRRRDGRWWWVPGLIALIPLYVVVLRIYPKNRKMPIILA